MKNLFYLLTTIFLYCTNVSAQNNHDDFLDLACDFFEYNAQKPKEFFALNVQLYPPVGISSVEECGVLGISTNGNSALVYRKLNFSGSEAQEQILHVNKQSDQKVLYVYGRSNYLRPRFTSRSSGEGGSRGGTPLPPSLDTLDFSELTVSYFTEALGIPGHFQVFIKENRKFKVGDGSIGQPVDGSDRYNRAHTRGFAVNDCGGGSIILTDGSVYQHQIRSCHPGRR